MSAAKIRCSEKTNAKQPKANPRANKPGPKSSKRHYQEDKMEENEQTSPAKLQCLDAGALKERIKAVQKMTLDDFKSETNALALLKARYPRDTKDELATKFRNMHHNLKSPQFWTAAWLNELELNTSAPAAKYLKINENRTNPTNFQKKVVELPYDSFKSRTNIKELVINELKTTQSEKVERMMRQYFDFLPKFDRWWFTTLKELEFNECKCEANKWKIGVRTEGTQCEMEPLVHSTVSDHGVSLCSEPPVETSQHNDDSAEAQELDAQLRELSATGVETPNLTLSAPAESETNIISIEEDDKGRVKQLTIDEINRKYLGEVEVLTSEDEEVEDISLAESTPENEIFEDVFVSCDSQPTELVSTQTHPAENLETIEPCAEAETLEGSATFRRPTNVAPRKKSKWLRTERDFDYSLRDVVVPQYTYDRLTFTVSTASTEATAQQIRIEPRSGDRSTEPCATERPLDSEIDDSSPTYAQSDQVSDLGGTEQQLQDLSSQNSIFLSSQIDRLINAQPERIVQTNHIPTPVNKRTHKEMSAPKPANDGHVSVPSTSNGPKSKSPIAFLSEVTVDSFRRENPGANMGMGVGGRNETIIRTSSNQLFSLEKEISEDLLKLTESERKALDNLLEFNQHNRTEGAHDLVDRTLKLLLASENRLVSRYVSYHSSGTEDVHHIAAATRPDQHMSEDQLLQIIDPFVLQSMASNKES